MGNFVRHICEGFDLYVDPNDERKYLVSITDLHQDGLNTSLENNPVCYSIPLIINGVKKTFPVISIFKRKPYNFNGADCDGNPVLYALKGSKKYNFNSSFDEERLINRFKEILKKVFNNKNNCTVIFPQYKWERNISSLVMVPTTNELNNIIVNAIKDINNNINFITSLLFKLDKTEVLASCQYPGSEFIKYYKHKNYSDKQIEKMLNRLSNMFDKMPNDEYQRHLITNKTFRNLVQKTIDIDKDEILSYQDNIDGKHILLVDDTLTYGQTIQECISVIYSAYTPASITILTLFSKKFNT